MFLCSAVRAEFYYNLEDAQLLVGQEMKPLEPDPMRGGKYTADKYLPDGLVLDETTGVISGTPTTATRFFQCTITYTPPEGEEESTSVYFISISDFLLYF